MDPTAVDHTERAIIAPWLEHDMPPTTNAIMSTDSGHSSTSTVKKKPPKKLSKLLKKSSSRQKLADDAVEPGSQKNLDTQAAAGQFHASEMRWWTNVSRKAELINSKTGATHSLCSPSLEDLVTAINHAEGITEFELEGTMKSKPAAVQSEETPEEHTYFRCDVYGTTGDSFEEADNECRQLVVEAGGEIVHTFDYVGGFLYSLPATKEDANPLSDSSPPFLGSRIFVKQWAPFDPAHRDVFWNPSALFNKPLPNPKEPKQPKEPQVPTTPSKDKMQDWLSRQKTKAATAQALASTTSLPNDLSETGRGPRDLNENGRGPRGLEPGVEMAILNPNMIRSSVSGVRLARLIGGARLPRNEELPPTQVEEGMNEYDDSGSDKSSIKSEHYGGMEARAVGIRVANPSVVHHTFGPSQETRRVEDVYRAWAAAMARRGGNV